jgi:ABC-2 type transport system permease protein
MTAMSATVTDSATMLRRNLRHMRRYPSMTGLIIGMPVIFLLIFVYAFGHTLGTGLGAGHSGGYVNFVAPGIILLAVASAAQSTAISVAMDMTEGIVARFRTMAIARSSVLAGHVLGSLIQALIGVAAVTGVALLVGFRPSASAGAWLAVIGLLTLTSYALTWLSVALGLAADSVETASNTPMFLMLLPLLSSGFVPATSMAPGLRWFAEYQPFTSIIDAVRALLTGGPVGDNAIVAAAWAVGVAALSTAWALRLYRRDPRPGRAG